MADLRDDDNPSPWIPESIPYRIAILGKALEEINELGSIVALIKENGIENDLGNKSYRQCLYEEIADVSSLITHMGDAFDLFQTRQLFVHRPMPYGVAINELGNAVARVLIQGIDECEPVTKKPNKEALEDKIAALQAVFDYMVDEYDLDDDLIMIRSAYKFKYLLKWLVQLGYEPKTA